ATAAEQVGQRGERGERPASLAAWLLVPATAEVVIVVAPIDAVQFTAVPPALRAVVDLHTGPLGQHQRCSAQGHRACRNRAGWPPHPGQPSGTRSPPSLGVAVSTTHWRS